MNHKHDDADLPKRRWPLYRKITLTHFIRGAAYAAGVAAITYLTDWLPSLW
jgi:hypothetical protein